MTKQDYTENTLQNCEDIWLFSTIANKLAMGRQESMKSMKILLPQRKNEMRTGKNIPWIYWEQEGSMTGRQIPYGRATTLKNKLLIVANYHGEL